MPRVTTWKKDDVVITAGKELAQLGILALLLLCREVLRFWKSRKRRKSTVPFLFMPGGLTFTLNFESLVFHYLSVNYLGVEAKYIQN